MVILISNHISAQQASTFNISGSLFTDEDAVLTYSIMYINGSAIPAWLAFTSPALAGDNLVFSGNYPTFENIDFDFLVTAEDQYGQSASEVITVNVQIICHSNCETCTNNGTTDCLSCYPGSFLLGTS
jgi:hypothetical protein